MWNEDSIKETAQGFQKSRILLTAYELGVFTAIGKNNKTSAQVAKIIGAKQRSTGRLMNALCAMGLLKKKKERFSNTKASLSLLVENKPRFLSGLKHTVHLWDSWGTLTQAVRRGKSVLAKHINQRGNDWLMAFIAAMHERASNQAPHIVKLLDLKNARRILDVGGGSSAYSAAFVRAKKDLKATVFDLPNVITLTKRYVREAGLSGKINTVTGDYNRDKLGNSFDLVFLSAIIHSNSFKENLELIKKCSKALNTCGQIIIQDFIMDENRASPAFGAFFSLNMLVGTESGDTYTEKEVRTWLKKAGITSICRKDTGFGTTLIIGRKTR